jgi:hypothetical protein
LSVEDSQEIWRTELERPAEGFFAAFAARTAEVDGARDATREALKLLIPAVDWKGHLPHVPHGLLGTWAVWALRPRLTEGSFLRLLALQLHAFAHEPREARGVLGRTGAGSGNWANIGSAIHARRPSIAWGECQGIESPALEDFARVMRLAAPDMANVGHKPVLAWAMGGLFGLLDSPRATGRRMLGLCAWLAATEPADLFWHQRASVRLEGSAPRIPLGPSQEPESHGGALREVCDLGLVDLLDRWCARLKKDPASGDLLSILALAAAEKQLDARRDLEGKTAWNWVFLAALAQGLALGGDPGPYAQAAALVNLFPTDDEEGRVRPKAPRLPVQDPSQDLQDAILDGEVPEAMFLAGSLWRAQGEDAVLDAFAEAASRNDPAFNHSHQILAVAAASALLPHLTEVARAATLESLAKFLANSQGSADLGRKADRALAGRAG